MPALHDADDDVLPITTGMPHGAMEAALAPLTVQTAMRGMWIRCCPASAPSTRTTRGARASPVRRRACPPAITCAAVEVRVRVPSHVRARDISVALAPQHIKMLVLGIAVIDHGLRHSIPSATPVSRRAASPSTSAPAATRTAACGRSSAASSRSAWPSGAGAAVGECAARDGCSAGATAELQYWRRVFADVPETVLPFQHPPRSIHTSLHRRSPSGSLLLRHGAPGQLSAGALHFPAHNMAEVALPQAGARQLQPGRSVLT